MKIKAAVVPGMGQPFELKDVELEEPKANEILVKLVATGLCHTDLLFKDHMPIPLPAVYGHEGAGIVESVGANVTALKPGDHVALSYNSCGKCKNCMNGMPFYCVSFMPLNFGGVQADGRMPMKMNEMPVFASFFGQSSFAAYALATERNAVKVPNDVPIEILGPLGCGVQTGAGTVINALKAKAGSSIAVFGTGAVGLSAVIAAKAIGCTIIVGVDINPERLEIAKTLGATHTVNSAEKDPADSIREVTGLGVDYSIETTAVPAVFRKAVEALDPTGTCVLLGAPPMGTEVTFDMNTFLAGRRTRGVLEGDSIPHLFIPDMIELYRQGKFPFDKMIKYYSFKDINKAVEDSVKGVTIKPVVRFDV